MKKILNREKYREQRKKDLELKQEIDKLNKNVKLEKHDVFAMTIAALSVFLPVILIFVAILAFFSWLLFGRG